MEIDQVEREPGAAGRVLLVYHSVPVRTIVEGGPLETIVAESKKTARNESAVERAVLCARVAEDHKGKNIVVLDLRELTPIFDFFVIITGGSRRQIHTLAEEIDAALHAQGEKRLSIQGYEASRWIVQDYGDVLVHVFDPDAREYYALEDLWADAPRIDWQRA